MKSSWPRVEVRMTTTFEAEHSLPWTPERHKHSYELECGYCHEINPASGVTKKMGDAGRDVDQVLALINGKYINDVLPVPPTAEMLVCWFLAQLPEYWDFVSVHCYGSFRARIERRYLTSQWVEKLRASHA